MLLSICIPTRNRIRLLSQCVEALLPQIIGKPVEVCISNNGSTDGTDFYLNDLTKRVSSVRVLNHSSNVGIDRNMASVVDMAQGHYIWQIGDDDIILPEGIAGCLAALEEPFDMMVVQGLVTNLDLSVRSKFLPSTLSGLVFHDHKSAFISLWDMMRYGSIILPRAVANRPAVHYAGTQHAYSGVVWDHLAEATTRGLPIIVRCGTEPWIALREVPKSYSGYYSQILLLDIPEWFGLLPVEYHAVSFPILKSYLRREARIRCLLRHLTKGQLTIGNVFSLTRRFDRFSRVKAFCIALVALPLSIVFRSLLVLRGKRPA